MKKILLLCLICVLCLGSLMAAEVQLVYKPTVTAKNAFDVYQTTPTFATDVSISGEKVVGDKNLSDNVNVYIAWNYILADAGTSAKIYTVELSSKNGSKLKNKDSVNDFEYTVALDNTSLVDAKNSKVTGLIGADGGKLPTTGGTKATFTFENTLREGSTEYNREFWGAAKLTINKVATNLNVADILDGNYTDTITITLKTE